MARRLMRRVPAAGVLARTLCGVALGLSLCAAGFITTSTPAVGGAQASLTSNITFFRLAGSDRYATAATIATETFGADAPTVILTTGTDFPDAIAAAYLAGTETGGAPILLTDPTALSSSAGTALADLHATHVVIVGGTSAVSAAVQDSLAQNYQVTRIAGPNRYDTAQLADTQPGAPVGTDGSGQRSAVLVSGVDFPDALSGAALAYARHLPLVLTAPTQLSAQAEAVLSADHIAHVVSVSTSGSLAPTVNNAVKALGISVDAVSGATPSATSALLATDEVANYGFSDVHFDLASGTDSADALVGGPNAGASAAPLLLTSDGSDPGSAPGWIAGHCSTLRSSEVLGGTGALGASTVSLAGLACPSNGSVQLRAATLATSTTGESILTASVELCGAPGSSGTCRTGSDQKVAFSALPSRSGACGTLSTTSATTDSSGEASTNDSATSTGTCIVTAKANGYSSSVALAPTAPTPTPPCACCESACCEALCCGPIPASGQSAQSSTCCTSPPCTTQVCPFDASSDSSASDEPAIIICPLEPPPSQVALPPKP